MSPNKLKAHRSLTVVHAINIQPEGYGQLGGNAPAKTYNSHRPNPAVMDSTTSCFIPPPQLPLHTIIITIPLNFIYQYYHTTYTYITYKD